MTYYNTLEAAGIQPDANMVIGWDSAKIVISALRKFGPKATAEQIRDYIANLHGWYGAAGQYDFRDGSQRGLTAKTSIVVRFDVAKQRFVPVTRIGGTPIRSTGSDSSRRSPSAAASLNALRSQVHVFAPSGLPANSSRSCA